MFAMAMQKKIRLGALLNVLCRKSWRIVAQFRLKWCLDFSKEQ
jgi:hypothetical protein